MSELRQAAVSQDRDRLPPEEDTMLELIAMVAGLAVCVWMPVEMGKLR